MKRALLIAILLVGSSCGESGDRSRAASAKPSSGVSQALPSIAPSPPAVVIKDTDYELNRLADQTCEFMDQYLSLQGRDRRRFTSESYDASFEQEEAFITVAWAGYDSMGRATSIDEEHTRRSLKVDLEIAWMTGAFPETGPYCQALTEEIVSENG